MYAFSFPGPLSHNQPKSVTSLQHSPVSIPCGVTGKPRYWSHHDTVVQGDQDSGPLVFNRVTMEDTGVYTCTGVNRGELVQSSVILTINERPGIFTSIVICNSLSFLLSLSLSL